MSLDPGTILSIIDLVQRAVAIYKCIDDLPQQMAQLGKRMETLNVFLVSFSAFVKDYPRSTQKQDLTLYLKNIEENVDQVHELFDRYQKGIVSRSHDLELRFRWATSLWYSLIDNSPEKIQAIMDEIEHYTTMLNNYMTLELLRLTQAALKPKPKPKPAPQTAASKPKPSPTQPPQPGANPNARIVTVNPKPPRPTTPNPPPPTTPAAPRLLTPPRSLSILIIDPSNTGRSIQAEALLRLLAHRFPRFPLTKIHSAGFFVRDPAPDSCAALIANLDYALPTFQKPFTPSGAPPQPEALAGVFDLGGDAIPDVRKAFEGRGSRGVRRGLFGYDFVAVFTKRELVNLGKLRKAVGGGARAKVVHLGDYKGEGFREIGVPTKSRGGKEDWEKKAREICTALEGFLRKEVGWVPPVQAVKDGTLAVA
ncbi:hypothetical protein B0T25DRAFT_455314 [Lasiosphaeria hispida]|uniref:NACHT-NTPase and P-loop NTPases N-terminal domain-containing protein n=1 Tax=Lasiosphaeria hispida TaxID=260671 RepID=A0AAJ0HGY8_9PEZI|nr:hypothetical protein B0T25DRAFT_455314 [Lasiosphaeria hispida]